MVVRQHMRCVARLLVTMTAVACATRRPSSPDVIVANAGRRTLSLADTGATIVCTSAATTRAALRDVRISVVGSNTQALTGSDGCATLVHPAGEVTMSLTRIAYTRVTVPITVRPGFADTVRVRMPAGGVPTDAACREARRRGEGCL